MFAKGSVTKASDIRWFNKLVGPLQTLHACGTRLTQKPEKRHGFLSWLIPFWHHLVINWWNTLLLHAKLLETASSLELNRSQISKSLCLPRYMERYVVTRSTSRLRLECCGNKRLTFYASDGQLPWMMACTTESFCPNQILKGGTMWSFDVVWCALSCDVTRGGEW